MVFRSCLQTTLPMAAMIDPSGMTVKLKVFILELRPLFAA